MAHHGESVNGVDHNSHSVPPHPVGHERPIMGSSEGAAEREAQTTAQTLLLRLMTATEEDREGALRDAAYEIGRLVRHELLDKQLWVDSLRAAAVRAELVADHGEGPVHEVMAAAFAEGERATVEDLAIEAETVKGEKPKGHTPAEADLADRFVERHGDALRYVAEWSKWLHYDGKVWRKEPTLLVRDYAKKLCQEAAGKAKELRSLASAKTIGAVQTLAQAHRRIAATVEQWDADPWLLNTPAGVIDLRTITLAPHSPDDHATKITGAAPADTADCARWLRFLDRIFAGNADLIAYMQRVLGYSLTGITTEHAMFFAYGTGGNGKSVLIDTVAGILGDYHTTAPVETFTASMGSRHPTELADLVGARLVTAIETEQGHAWAEAKIKTLTGGDRVKARYMRQDFFEYRPQFKLLVAGNHQPVLHAVDEAIKRRFNMLPFEVKIPAEERDPDLTAKLREEWPAILQWMLDGCRAWQEGGLQPPVAVTEATGNYLDGQDAVGAWLAECCEERSTYQERASALYASWKGYAERNGEIAGSQKSFGPQLEARGFRKKKGNKCNSYQGLKLIEEEPPMPSWPDR